MRQFIALFRGINVGGKHIIKMDELSRLMEQLDCYEIRSYIQSGNMVFKSHVSNIDRLTVDIAESIHTLKGFTPSVLILDYETLKSIVKSNPFSTDEGKALHFFFLKTPVTNPDIDKIEEIKKDSENYLLTDRAFLLYAPEGIGRSQLAAKIESILKIPVTARNWNTVKKILDLST